MLQSTSSRVAIDDPFGVPEQDTPEGRVPILLQYWHTALRWKWVIAGVFAATLVAGLLLTLLTTPQYTATSRIEISREQKNVTSVEGLESAEAGRDLEFYQTQYSLLKARSVAERVSRVMRLASNADFFEAHGESIDAGSSMFGSNQVESASDRQKREEMAVEMLLEHVSISPIRNSSLVDVNYTSASPTMSARVANAWVEQFVRSSMDRRYASTADARKFLEERLADLRTRLEESERQSVNYASAKDIVTLSRVEDKEGRTQNQQTLATANLQILNNALAEAIADRVLAESKARGGRSGATPEALSNVAISQLRQKRAEVAAEYAKSQVQFEAGYPAARALAEQLRVLDASIAREETRVSTSRSAEYSEAAQREASLRGRVEALKSRLDTQQRDSIQYNIFLRDADTNRQLYDALLQRYKEIGVAGVGANNIAIVDVAESPKKPSSPNLLLNLALTILAGLGLAAATAFGLEQLDEGLRDPSQVNRLLNIPLLGAVPDVGEEDPRAALTDPKSALYEAYLSIRSNLSLSTDHGVPKTLVVTSTRAAEGKSTTSYALATALNRTGKRVLLVDADMRSPSMHGFLNRDNNGGLSNLLAGETDWQKYVLDTGIENLSLIPAGPMPPSAAELLSTDRPRALFKQMAEHFDHVVIDAPPVLGLADAPLLVRAAEGCVYVAEAEGVAVRGIKASLARLFDAQSHVLGVVLTKLHQRHTAYGYGYGYGDSYRYG